MSVTNKNILTQSRDKRSWESSADTSLAERQAHTLARAKEAIARSKAREEAENRRTPPSKKLTATELKRKIISELAIPHVNNPWQSNPNPTLMFCGRIIYRRKNAYGW